jgi:hypothetical protein
MGARGAEAADELYQRWIISHVSLDSDAAETVLPPSPVLYASTLDVA